VGCPQGGTEATVIKNNARAALVDLLRQEAVYVQGTAFVPPPPGFPRGRGKRRRGGHAPQLHNPEIQRKVAKTQRRKIYSL